MAAETTTPSRTLRRLGRSDIGLLGCDCSGCGGEGLGFGGLGRFDLPLAQDAIETGDLPLDLAQAGIVVELPGGVLEAQVEQLLLGLGQVGQELVVVELSQLCRAGHQNSSARVTNLALIGSFWMARSMASRARDS